MVSSCIIPYVRVGVFLFGIQTQADEQSVVVTRQLGEQVNVSVLFRELHFALAWAEETLVGEYRDSFPQYSVVLLLRMLLDKHHIADSDVLWFVLKRNVHCNIDFDVNPVYVLHIHIYILNGCI